jgi:hypothetical protein
MKEISEMEENPFSSFLNINPERVGGGRSDALKPLIFPI